LFVLFDGVRPATRASTSRDTLFVLVLLRVDCVRTLTVVSRLLTVRLVSFGLDQTISTSTIGSSSAEAVANEGFTLFVDKGLDLGICDGFGDIVGVDGAADEGCEGEGEGEESEEGEESHRKSDC
jgi:hypothetical protein